MKINLVQDIQKDRFFMRFVWRTILFVFFVFLLDFAFSSFLQRGIEANYGLNKNASILLVGHSHLMLALDKTAIERVMSTDVAKYTREGVNIADRYIMLRQYFEGKSDNCKIVVLGVDPWVFTGEGLSANSYMLFLPFMDNTAIADYIHNNIKSEFDYYRYKFFRTSRYNTTLLNASLRGYLSNWDNLKFGRLDSVQLASEINKGNYRKVEIKNENMQELKKILAFLHAKKVKVILLNTPVYSPVTEIQKARVDEVFNLIKSWIVAYPEMHFLDLSPSFNTQTKLFFDPIHMNPEGQKVVTESFIHQLDSIQKLNY